MFKKITTKIFAIMLLIVILILSVQVLFQTFFLENFYINKEIDRIQKNVYELSEEIADTMYKDRNNNYILKDYIGNFNDTIIIENDDELSSVMAKEALGENIQFERDEILDSEFGLIVKSNENKIYYVSLEAFDIESSNYIMEGDNLLIEGKLIDGEESYVVAEKVDISDSNNIFIQTINAYMDEYGAEYSTEFIDEFYSDARDLKISGTVVYNNPVDLFEQVNFDSESRVYQAVDDIYKFGTFQYEIENRLDLYEVGTSDYNVSEDASGKYILFVQKVAYKSGESRFVYSFTELKQIEGTIAIFNSYMWVTIGVSVLISFIGSIILSRYLSRPIIEINNVATKISKLDFSEEVKYKSRDEIGNLGVSLNLMANQLESKIVELEGMNDELNIRLEYKTKQENIRKEFVANVSHELKTPITVMKGFIEGIRDGVYKNDKYDQAMVTIYKETEAMEELIVKMLNLSKLESEESGTLEYNKEMFDVASEILMVLYRYKPIIINRNINVISNTSESIVLGDNEKIQIVLDNLISNAVKYTSENGTMKVDVKEDTDEFKISIYNDCDIPSNMDLQELWKPFFKADKSGNKALSGTGLGLAIVKKILDIHSSTYAIGHVDNGIVISFTLEKGEENQI